MTPNAICVRTMGDPLRALHSFLPQAALGTTAIWAGGDQETVNVTGGSMSKEDLRHELRRLARTHGVRILVLDRKSRDVMYEGLESKLKGPAGRLVKRMHSRRGSSYGAASNEAFLVALLLEIGAIHFVDDDCLALRGVDLFGHYRDVMSARDAGLVGGPYIANGCVDTSFFPRPAQQAYFAAAMMKNFPTRTLVRDQVPLGADISDEVCDWSIAGNLRVSAECFSRVACCIVPETMFSDDVLYGYLASRVFPNRVRRTNIPVIHAHNANRKTPDSVRRYLRNCLRSVALWPLMDEAWSNCLACSVLSRPHVQPPLALALARTAVAEFVDQLHGLVKSSDSPAEHLVSGVTQQLYEDPSGKAAFDEDVVQTVGDGLIEYAELLANWHLVAGALDSQLRTRFVDLADCCS